MKNAASKVNPLNRREFLVNVSTVSAVVAAGGVLSACSDGVPMPVEFNYGVASGDPLADRIILWTHAKYQSSTEPVALSYQVSNDAAFTSIVTSGVLTASADTGYTAKVDATGLSAGKTYFYRFFSGRSISPVGQTRTLPAANTTEVTFSVFSCADYPLGFFNAYAEAAKRDSHFAIHLGDYIYEYGTGTAPTDPVILNLKRYADHAKEILSLDDYRKRHALYKSDPDSKVFHAKMPLIAVWDDHEVSNDSYKDGAQAHDPATDGVYTVRRAAGLQAFHEWMPIRTDSDKTKIYRSFDFGSLVSLHMLETRHIARDKQIQITELAGLAGAEKQASAYAEYIRADRQMLGATQLAWLQQKMATSQATWQVLGQQVLMARMESPASVLSKLNGDSRDPTAQQQGLDAITAYLTAKGKKAAGASLTAEESALLNTSVNPKLGYNLDAWDGYIVAREVVLASALQLNKKLISLAGDTHNGWHSDLTLMGLSNPALANLKVGEEFATPGVSSGGFEEYLPAFTPAQVKYLFENIVDDLRWLNPSQRGYLKMTFTATEAKGEWIFVNQVLSRTYTAEIGHTAPFRAASKAVTPD
jgi:alkaline phosphatase D